MCPLPLPHSPSPPHTVIPGILALRLLVRVEGKAAFEEAFAAGGVVLPKAGVKPSPAVQRAAAAKVRFVCGVGGGGGGGGQLVT